MADTTPGFFTLPVSFLGKGASNVQHFCFDKNVTTCKWRNRLNIRLYVLSSETKLVIIGFKNVTLTLLEWKT